MDATTMRQAERFGRAHDFIQAHSGDFAAGSRVLTLNAQLVTVRGGISAQGADQGSSNTARKTATRSKSALVSAVLKDLRDIAATARLIHRDDPAFPDSFALAISDSDTQTMTTARGFLKDASVPAVKAQFLAYEMPSDFLADLSADIAAYDALGTTQNNEFTDRREASAALDALVEQGIGIMEALDRLIQNRYRADPVVLAAWHSASHLERAPRHAKPAPPVPPVPPSPPAS